MASELKNRDLFDHVRNQKIPIQDGSKLMKDSLYSFVVSKWKYENVTKKLKKEITDRIDRFSRTLYSKWTAASRQRGPFFKQNQDWLKGEFEKSDERIVLESPETPVSHSLPGRPNTRKRKIGESSQTLECPETPVSHLLPEQPKTKKRKKSESSKTPALKSPKTPVPKRRKRKKGESSESPVSSRLRPKRSKSNSIDRSEPTFSEYSTRRQQQLTAKKASTISTPTVFRLTRYKLNKKGLKTESQLFTEITKSHEQAKQIKKKASLEENDILPIPYTNIEAMAFLLDNNLTVPKYQGIRKGAKRRRANIYPTYNKIKIAKEECYPTNIRTTQVGSWVPLQNLLNHTAQRILKFLTETTDFIINKGDCFELICKWGLDGTSDQAQYKQKFQKGKAGTVSENSLIVVMLVPLRLTVRNSNTVVWENVRYSSPRFCRPICFEFAKETNEKTKEYVDDITQQIANLTNSQISIKKCRVTVKHTMILSMINGKTCSAITDISSQNCQICTATPSQMNDLRKADIEGNPSTLGYGISVLHTNIKCFECMLHVAYRLQVQKWRITSKADKQIVEETKKKIQNKFKNRLGLNVDVILQGKGTTNDGNTARKFFQNASISAQITGLDKDLIIRFQTLLCAINSGLRINVANFKTYATETAQKFVELYWWYYLPAHVHKLLMHGGQIIENLLLPLGQLSEEAAEASNKFVRRYRREHTRKNCRINTNKDLMNMLLASSDPYLSSLRMENKSKTPLTSEARNLVFEGEEESEDYRGAEEELDEFFNVEMNEIFM